MRFLSGKLSLFFLAIVIAGLGASTVEAGVYYSPYWGCDYYGYWATPVTVTVPTGYYNHWYYTPPTIYKSRWGLGWGAYHTYPCFYGFRDSLTYTYYAYTPRYMYWWSRYWDPEATGYTLDMVTDGNDTSGDLLPFDPSIESDVDILSHTYEINDGCDSGSFTDLTWVTATDSAIRDYLASLSLDQITIDDIMDDDMVLNVISNNDTGNKVIGLQLAGPYNIPEPTTLCLLVTGLLAIVGLRLRARKRS